MDTTTEEAPALDTRGTGRRCSAYDEDCEAMTDVEARWCFMGCRDHPCAGPGYPADGLGIADGYCPILHRPS